MKISVGFSHTEAHGKLIKVFSNGERKVGESLEIQRSEIMETVSIMNTIKNFGYERLKELGSKLKISFESRLALSIGIN